MVAARLTHFSLLLLYALCVSCVLGFLSRSTLAGRIRSSIWAFFLFVAVGVAVAWLLYPFSH